MSYLNQQNIIILETNPLLRDDLRSLASGLGFTPYSFEKEAVCLENLPPIRPCLVISGALSLEKTFRFINAIKTINYHLPVLIISDDHAIQDFININGFNDVLTLGTSFEPSEIKDAIHKAQANLSKNKNFQDCPLIIGQSPEILKIKKLLSELSLCRETVLIQGETGTGKDLVAKVIHLKSSTNNNLFIKVDAADFSRLLFKKKSSKDFTRASFNASAENNGKYQVAGAVTIYLDKIEKIPAALQGNLLHVLEYGISSNLGFNPKGQSNARIIASANDDLDRLVKKGKFRKDLYFRLNIIRMNLPPLRKRIEDIPALTDYFVDKVCMELGKSCHEISKKTKDIFSRYRWPGNVKELNNVIKNGVLQGNENNIINNFALNNPKHNHKDIIDDDKNLYTLVEFSNLKQYVMELPNLSLKDICRKFIARTEKIFMQKALERSNWNRKKAANLLDISYKSLLNKIKAYNITC